MDNTVPMACLNKMGSSKSEKLNTLTKAAWHWCNIRHLWLTVARIASAENAEEDHESRHVNLDIERKLYSKLLTSARSVLKFQPVFNLFASRLNQQFQTFISFRPDTEASRIGAFSFKLQGNNFYASRPFSFRLLQKIKQGKALFSIRYSDT